jgi:zinc protease
MVSSPNVDFSMKQQEFLNKENPRYNGIIPDEKAWENTDYALAHKYFTERFSNAADFDFNFVGNIDENKLEEFASKYIASIPGNATKIESSKDLGYRNVKGSHKLNINKGTDPKSNVSIQMYGETTYNENERLYMGMMGEILSIKLTEKLREATSGVYTVRASGNMSKIPYESYNFNISFPCGPENVEKLTALALEELQKIIDNGPDAKDLDKIKETRLLEFKENSKKNDMWSNMLVRKYNLKTDLSEFLDTEKNVKAVTAENIKSVAKKYLTKDKVISTLLPESK